MKTFLRIEKAPNHWNYKIVMNGQFMNVSRNKALELILQSKLLNLKGKLTSDVNNIIYLSQDKQYVEAFKLPIIRDLIRDEFMDLSDWIEVTEGKILRLESELWFEGEV